MIEFPTCNQYRLQGEMFSRAVRRQGPLAIALEVFIDIARSAREEVADYPSPRRSRSSGDHDLKPRKLVNGLTASDHLQTVGEAVAAWARRIVC